MLLEKNWKVGGVEKDQLFAVARENLRRNYPYTLKNTQFGPISVSMFTAEHVFASSSVLLDIKQLEQGKFGLVFAIPNRHQIVLTKIQSEQELQQIVQILAPITRDLFASVGGSISKDLHLYHEGKFSLIKIG